jgi:dipicolinate synthase subunit B
LELINKKIGYCFTGSFCTFRKSINEMKRLVTEKKAHVYPIMSYNSYNLDTKFGKAQDFIKEIEKITGNKIIHSIQDAEPIGPKDMFDILLIAPCSRKYHFKTCK